MSCRHSRISSETARRRGAHIRASLFSCAETGLLRRRRQPAFAMAWHSRRPSGRHPPAQGRGAASRSEQDTHVCISWLCSTYSLSDMPIPCRGHLACIAVLLAQAEPFRSFCLCTAQAHAVLSRQERSPMPSGTGLLERSCVWSYWMRVRQYGQTFHSAFSGRWQVGQTFLTWVLQTGQTTKSRSIGVPHFGQMP